MKLAIVGSQAISRAQGETAWFIIEGLIAVYDPSVVISGGATGIDSVAEAVAKNLGYVPVEEMHINTDYPKQLNIYTPEVKSWDPVGQYGYKARNDDVAKACDVLWRVAKKDRQTTYGSGWTADRAEGLGKDVHRVWL
jgi:hypothetical protein